MYSCNMCAYANTCGCRDSSDTPCKHFRTIRDALEDWIKIDLFTPDPFMPQRTFKLHMGSIVEYEERLSTNERVLKHLKEKFNRSCGGMFSYVFCHRPPTAFCEYRAHDGLCAKLEPCRYKMFRTVLRARGSGKSMIMRGVEDVAPYNEEDKGNG